MKRYCIFIFLLIAIVTNAQKFEQKIEKSGNKYNVIYNGKDFTVDTSIFVVKVTDEKYLKENYDVIRYNKLGYADVRKPNDVSMESFANRIISDNKIIEACYNTFGEYCSFTPNDAYEQTQWALNAINVRSAWDFTKGSPNVIVGVLDSGLEWTHQDIGLGYNSYQNVYLNSGEDSWSNANTPSTGNHWDDDGNGHIDDWKGWNFASNSNDVRTNNGHGTKVTGIIAAKSNNNVGIAGISGGNGGGSKIVFCVIGEQEPDASLVDDAIIYAVDIGAKVINMSLDVNSTPAIESAIQYAINNNVVLIASSGNDGIDGVLYPASNTNVMAVGASNMNNKWVSLSNFGNEMSVVAPGINVLTTTLNNSYVTDGGTSIAAPHVSGVAALMLSANPSITAIQVKTIIEQTAQRVHNNDEYVYTNNPSAHPNGDWNIKMGYGLIDAHKAVMEAFFYNHAIEGDNQLSSCGEYEYSVSGEVPDCASLTWELSDNLEEVSRQGTTITVRPIGYGAGWINAKFEHENYIVTKTKNLNVTSGYTYPIYKNYTASGSLAITADGIISGAFTVPNNSTVTISSTIHCSPTAEFFIQPGGKLIIDGGTLTNLCPDKMWNGIYVVGDSTQRQIATKQGTLEVKNGSVIENSKNAIVTWDGSDYATSGGIVKCSNSLFLNNGQSIRMYNYTNHTSSGTETDNVNYAQKCMFVVDGNNLFASNNITFSEFVKISHVRGISFKGSSFRDGRATVSTTTKGIWSIGAGFNASEHCSTAYNSNAPCTCPAVETRSKFSRLGYGIYAENDGTTYNFTTDHAIFDTCYRAIQINAVNNCKVTRSDFDQSSQGIFSSSAATGVYLYNSTGYTIEANSFATNYTTMPSGFQGRGVYVQGSGTDANTIYRNTITKLYHGIKSNGSNGGLQILCNVFSGAFFADIYVSGAFSSSQGQSSKSAGNTFTSGAYNLRNYSSNNVITYYHSGASNSGNNFCPYNSLNTTFVANVTANNCAPTICNPLNLIDPIKSLSADDITLYESLQQIYESRLTEYTAAGYDFLLENFDENDADIVAIARLKQDTLISLSRTMAEIANRNLNAILADSVLDRESLNGWYNRINTTTAKYSLANSYFEIGEYALARQELAAIPQHFALSADELAEYDNFCDYNALRESVFTSGRNYAQLTEEEIAELEAIADLNTGVSSAYANSVLCFFYGICREIDEAEIDDTPMNNKNAVANVEENETESLAVYVYPNPADEELNILISSLPEGITTIEFHDVAGRLILSQEIASTNASINISSLKQGVYMYRIVNGDNVIARDRIVKE